jgi:hypothetical protein
MDGAKAADVEKLPKFSKKYFDNSERIVIIIRV